MFVKAALGWGTDMPNPWSSAPGWGNPTAPMPGQAMSAPYNPNPAYSWFNPGNVSQTGAQTGGGGQGNLPWMGSNLGNGATPINRLPMHSDMDLQLYSPEQLNQADFFAGQLAEHGPWAPWMTNVNQFLAAPYREYDASYSQPGQGIGDAQQRYLDQYTNIMGTQQDQANRAAYFRMMGSGNVGGVVRPPPSNLFEGQRNPMQPGDPLCALNSMGIYSNTAVPPTYIQNFTRGGPGIETIPTGTDWGNPMAGLLNDSGLMVNPWTGARVT